MKGSSDVRVHGGVLKLLVDRQSSTHVNGTLLQICQSRQRLLQCDLGYIAIQVLS